MLARQRSVRKSVGFLVDAMRCIPFLLLAYLVYYGLPELGLRFDSWTCGVSALVLYHSAYIAEIVRRVKARPSYVAQVLQTAGHLDGYFDLYTTTGREQNVYTRYFRNVLAFRNLEAARESVARIDRLYNYFERLGDRAGQHQAMVLALTGKNRARWSGKLEESEVFSEWLAAH